MKDYLNKSRAVQILALYGETSVNDIEKGGPGSGPKHKEGDTVYFEGKKYKAGKHEAHVNLRYLNNHEDNSPAVTSNDPSSSRYLQVHETKVKTEEEHLDKSNGESEPLRDFHGRGEFDADGLEPTVKIKKSMESNFNSIRAAQILSLYGQAPVQRKKADDEDQNNDAQTPVNFDTTSSDQPDITIIDSDLNLTTKP